MAARRFFSPFHIHQRAAEESEGLPALLAAARTAAQFVSHGGHQRRRAGVGENFWQFRDYHPGDRPQDIDWRQSARTDRVFVKERERQTAHPSLFWCAGDAGMRWRSTAALPEKRDAALTLLTALMILLHEGGEEIGVLGGTRPTHGAASVDATLQTLFDSPGGNAIPALPLRNRAFVVLGGDFLTPPAEFERAIVALSASAAGGLVVQVLDPAELDLPYAGRVIFESPSGGQPYPVAEAAAMHDAYGAAITAHINAVAAICHRYGWTNVLHRTDLPVRATLGDIHEQLTTRRVERSA